MGYLITTRDLGDDLPPVARLDDEGQRDAYERGPAQAQKVLCDFDRRSVHYEVLDRREQSL